MVYDAAAGYDLMFGGSLGNETWAYAHGYWTQLFPANPPPARNYPAMTYDAAAHYVLLFGGLYCGAYSLPCRDTWEFQGGNWTQLYPATSPSPCYWVSMAYDPTDGFVVLFDRCQGTWVWNGTTWSALTTSVVPLTGKYQPFQMAYDGASGRVVLAALSNFSNRAGRLFMMTAVFAHGNWTQLANTTALEGWGGPMAYDPQLGKLILFGAGGTSRTPRQTWEFGSGVWLQVHPARRPPRDAFDAMAYDPAGSSVILFAPNGTTWSFR